MSMISELKDDEILDFLMTSEFEGDYSPEELKYLLLKWRYFFRLSKGNTDRDITEKEGDIRRLNDEVSQLKVQINNTLSEKAVIENTIHQLENKKLSWKERFTGRLDKDKKINIQNED